MSADVKPRVVKRYPPTDETRRQVAAHLADRMGPCKSWILAEEVADHLGLARTTAGQILTAMWHDHDDDTDTGEPVAVVGRWSHSTNHRYRVEVSDAE